MKGVAKVAHGVGNVDLIEVPEPAVRPGNVRIEAKAAGVCGTDLHISIGQITAFLTETPYGSRVRPCRRRRGPQRARC